MAVRGLTDNSVLNRPHYTDHFQQMKHIHRLSLKLYNNIVLHLLVITLAKFHTTYYYILELAVLIWKRFAIISWPETRKLQIIIMPGLDNSDNLGVVLISSFFIWHNRSCKVRREAPSVASFWLVEGAQRRGHKGAKQSLSDVAAKAHTGRCKSRSGFFIYLYIYLFWCVHGTGGYVTRQWRTHTALSLSIFSASLHFSD